MVAAPSEETLSKLKDKFPLTGEFPGPLKNYADSMIASKDQVLSALKSFPVATGAGRDGLQAQHLLDALSVKSEQIRSQLLALITGYVNALLSGTLPDILSPFVGSAPVIPLLKANGGIRPIAVGEIWRRLTSKIAARHGTGTVRSYLSPHQVGVGTPNGGEAIVHSIARIVSEHGKQEGFTVLKVDYENAFNSLARICFLDAVNKHCSDISRWVEWVYLEESYMYFGSQVFPGVQQGDPLGPLLFALGIHPMILRMNAECNLLLNAWYLDDGTLVGPTEEVLKALSIIQEESQHLGLKHNLSKCEQKTPTGGCFLKSLFDALQPALSFWVVQ